MGVWVCGWVWVLIFVHSEGVGLAGHVTCKGVVGHVHLVCFLIFPFRKYVNMITVPFDVIYWN